MSKRKIKELGRGLVLHVKWRYSAFVIELEDIKINIEAKGNKNRQPYIGPHFKITEPETIYGLPKIYKYLEERNLVDDFTFRLEEELLTII
jgi:hypothetical protein